MHIACHRKTVLDGGRDIMKTQSAPYTPAVPAARAGFTLVEMLAVIAVMATLMTAGIMGMKSASSNKGPTAGLAVVDSLLAEARSVAKARGTNARLYIHSVYTPLADRSDALRSREANRYLRYMAVAYAELDDDRNPTDDWVIDNQGVLLPEDTYFDPDFSELGGANLQQADINLPGRGVNDVLCYYYEFNSQGRLVSPDTDGDTTTARLVLSGGTLLETSGGGDPIPRPRRAGERNYAGVVIWPTGRTSIIRDFDELDGGVARSVTP